MEIGNWTVQSRILISNIHLTVLLLLVTSCYDGLLHLTDCQYTEGLHLKVV